ncbi:hypothetical protein EGK68_26225 [Enterobacter cloacae]|uniref:Uncharacterized protein n=1 Tax=Enterobacter cloacae TaxID=550 RepID=A0A427KDS2_ENTCL|nr:hypothetical protein EGK68_26225 [Enterobacter cloacae]
MNAYKRNPDAYDNRGFLKDAKDAKDDKMRKSIIDGRIKHLEKEIKAFQNDIDKIKNKKE